MHADHCPICREFLYGEGEPREVPGLGADPDSDPYRCFMCNGTGWTRERACKTCEGSGRQRHPRGYYHTVYLTRPATPEAP